MTIAATLIVRDEARCIERCMASVRPWVDRIVVLDTGSVDGTAELARGAGAEVHHLDWPDDFSVARNHVLDLADADWNLVIDADECIVAGGERLREWCAGHGEETPRLGQVCILSDYDDAGNPAGGVARSRSWITRVLPRGVRFAGRIHEQVVSALPRERIALEIGHDGYRDAQLAAKRDRNRTLLLAEIAASPDDPYLAFQLGREAEGRGQWAEACRWYEASLARAAPDEGWRGEMVVRLLHSMGRAGRVAGALALAEARQGEFAGSPDFFFVSGNLALDRAMEDTGNALGHWLPLAVACWEECLRIGERPELEGSVAGRGSDLARHNLEVVRAQMAMLGR